MKPTKIEVRHQGAVIVNYAEIHLALEYMVAIVLDMKSKRIKVTETSVGDDGCPIIALGATEDSLYLWNSTDDTGVVFPEFKGWQIFSAQSEKYSTNIYLVRTKKPKEKETLGADVKIKKT